MENENIKDLLAKYSEINKKGWVEGIANGKANIGLTFEKELGIPKHNFEIPDFNDIEIKTHTNFCQFPMSLFKAAPDGSSLFEIKRITDTYGYSHVKYNDCNVFNGDVSAIEKMSIGKNYKFQLFANWELCLIELHIYDKNGVFIENTTHWTFELLEQKLYRKLKYMALIYASSKVINGKKHFKYTEISIYKLIDFREFVKAIENGDVFITFSVGLFLEGKRVGQMHDHGTAFRIYPSKLECIYHKIV